MMTCNIHNTYRKIILACFFGCMAVTMPVMATGATSTEERVLSHYEESLAPPKITASKSAIEGLIKTTRRNLATNAVLRNEILLDLNAWIDSSPHSGLTARALMLRAELFQQSSDKHLALLDWLSVRALFPSSRYADKAGKLALETIQEDMYKLDRETLESILKSHPKGNITYRHARLLESLSALVGAHFRDPLAHAYRLFLASFRSHELAPMVQMALAANRAMANVREAEFQYQTLIAIYPHSPYVADALLAVADFNQERFNKPDKAIAGYRKVIENYPKQAAARKAYHQLAITYERYKRDDGKAIATLKRLVRQYPRTEEASKGDEQLGRLYEKGKQYDAAVAAYRNMTTVSRDNDAIINALEKAAYIAKGKLDNYSLMIDIDNQLCRSYPGHDACAEAHYRNGTAYEKKLGDAKKATGEYQAVVKKFPNHYLAKKAASRIKSLNGRRSGLHLF